MLSPRNPNPRQNPEPPIKPSCHPYTRNASPIIAPSSSLLQNAIPPKTPLQSIRHPKTINHTHHHPPRAPSHVFAPIPRILPPSRSPQTRQSINSAMIATRKKRTYGGEEDEGKGAGWVLASVKLLGGGRQRLILLAEMRVLFPAGNIQFFACFGLARFMGSPL